MRFFIALEIPFESQQQIEEVQKKLHILIPQARMTNPNKLHLTLAFIGDQDDNLKDKLIDIIKNSVINIPPFSITPAYIDGFPNIHTPNTIWIGVKGDIDKLLLIRERIKDSLKEIKIIVDERRFTPHIAIAKVANLNIDPRTENALAGFMAKEFDEIHIGSIKLFESIPSEGFHSHNTLAEVKLILSS
jgi:RNA 2',3'-cyclic 3'-phosphodiesterase